MIEMNTDVCRRALKACLRVALDDNERPHLHAVLVECGDKGVTFSATDGRRIIRVLWIGKPQGRDRLVLPWDVAHAAKDACERHYLAHRWESYEGTWEGGTPFERYEPEPVIFRREEESGAVEVPGFVARFVTDGRGGDFVDTGKSWKGWDALFQLRKGSAEVRGVNAGLLPGILLAFEDLGGVAVRQRARGREDAIRFDCDAGEFRMAALLMPMKVDDRPIEDVSLMPHTAEAS